MKYSKLTYRSERLISNEAVIQLFHARRIVMMTSIGAHFCCPVSCSAVLVVFIRNFNAKFDFLENRMHVSLYKCVLKN